ncbi:MAG: RDD family protein, partial [Methylococcales bacterium]
AQTNRPGIPKGRPFPGFRRRLGAILYDGLVLSGLLFAATACVLPFNGGQAISPDQWQFPAYLALVSFLFFGWFWTHGGQTLGMRAWKIRVTNLSGEPITWSQALIRFACALLSWSAAGIGYWWIAFSRDHNGWHDLLSRSRIVWMDSST